MSEEDSTEPTYASIEELLSALELDDLGGLEAYFEGDLDSDVRATDAMQDYGEPGIELLLLEYGVGIVEPFPLTLSECWSDLYDLEKEYWIPIHLASLEDDIERVEGFQVEVEIDDLIDDAGILESVDRRQTLNGYLTQRVPSYPYKRPMSGAATVDEWLKARFFRRCPGLRVGVKGWFDTTLAELRREEAHSEMVSYGAEDDRRPRTIRIRD